jgi:hypothetical protein
LARRDARPILKPEKRRGGENATPVPAFRPGRLGARKSGDPVWRLAVLTRLAILLPLLAAAVTLAGCSRGPTSATAGPSVDPDAWQSRISTADMTRAAALYTHTRLIA